MSLLSVPEDEKIIRWIYDPRNYDVKSGKIKPNFICLRMNGENCISFTRMIQGTDTALQQGSRFIRMKKKKKVEYVWGAALALVKNIEAISKNEIKVKYEEINPLHAGVYFCIDGELIYGGSYEATIHSSKLQYFFDEILAVLNVIELQDFKEQYIGA